MDAGFGHSGREGEWESRGNHREHDWSSRERGVERAVAVAVGVWQAGPEAHCEGEGAGCEGVWFGVVRRGPARLRGSRWNGCAEGMAAAPPGGVWAEGAGIWASVPQRSLHFGDSGIRQIA